VSEKPAPDARRKVLGDYARKAAAPGLRPVLDADDEGDVKNAYLDYVHRLALAPWLAGLGPRVADLGCGIGRLTELVTDLSLTVGLDYSPDLLALAGERLGAGVGLARADLAALPVQSGCLTGAMMCFVALHFDDDVAQRAFAETARILQPGAIFLLFEHVSPADEAQLYHGVVGRTVPAITGMLEGAGFDVLAKIAVKKTPSRPVHWVKAGKLPRALWRFGAWFDRKTATRKLEHADYVEALFVARLRGGSAAPDLPSFREMTMQMFVPEALRRRRFPPR